MRSYRYFSYGITDPRWTNDIATSIDTLSNPRDSFEILLPKGKYFGRPTESEIIASFSVQKTMDATPRAIMEFVVSDNLKPGEVLKYVEGDNTWLLSREVGLVNGKVAYITLPTTPKTLVIGTILMETTSKMAKLIKEKMIPEVDYRNINVKIDKTNFWTGQLRSLYTPITPEKMEDVLLEHIDEWK